MLRTAPLLVFSLLALQAPAQRELLDRLPADAQAWHEVVVAGPDLQDVKLPGKGRFQGVALRKGELWLCRGDRIYRARWPSGEVLAEVEAPAKTRGLADGGRFVHALAGSQIVELDPLAGRPVREVEIDCDEPLIGLSGLGADLYALGVQHVFRVEIDKGTTTSLGSHEEREPQFLLYTGSGFAIGTSRGVGRFLAIGAPASAARGLPQAGWRRPVSDSAAAWIDGHALWMGAEEIGGVRTERSGWMVEEPGEQLSVKLLREKDGVLSWQVGPQRVASMEHVEKLMARVFANRATWVVGADGKPAPMPILLEPYPGVKVGEVASTWDLCRKIGFTVIRSPALEAWAREQPAGEKK